MYTEENARGRFPLRDILLKARPGECILIRAGEVRAVKIEMTEFESKFVTT